MYFALLPFLRWKISPSPKLTVCVCGGGADTHARACVLTHLASEIPAPSSHLLLEVKVNSYSESKSFFL